MAVTGDKDPRAAAIYTAAASQKLLAESAAEKLKKAERGTDVGEPG